jgi:hypothetical protein
MTLLPPPEVEEYFTQQSLIEAIQAHTVIEEYAVTIRHSNNSTKTVYLRCDREGTYWNHNNLYNGNYK